MYPGTYAAEAPDRVAAVMADTGETLSYGDLERRSVQLAHVLHDAGLRPGDVVALLTENNLRAFEVYWAAMRSGLYITAVNWHLKPDEVAYIVNDSGATALIVSAEQASTAEAITGLTSGVKLRLAYGGPVAGYGSYEDTIAAAPDEPFADQPSGSTMLYSSGTTGRPKGVRPSLPDRQVTEPGEALAGLASMFFGVNQDSVYLSPGPLYHAAPLRWSGSIQVLGGTVVMMKRFDAEQALAAIEDHHVTHAQFVPTMFVRMLQLPQETRDRYDVSSLRVAIHAAAPCPVEVKQQMIAWWGPILFEYYAGTEGNGMTAIDSATWLTKPGTVGRPIMGTVRICDDDGTELPAGQTGGVYFESDEIPFAYHNDPDKTRAASTGTTPTGPPSATSATSTTTASCSSPTARRSRSSPAASTSTRRKPRTCSRCTRPSTTSRSSACPTRRWGSRWRAFVQPAPGAVPGPELEQEIIAFVKSKIAGFKAPRTVRFVDSLPRSEAGKLMKTELKARYAGA